MNRGRPRHDDILTPREWEVLALLREDLTNEEIAERLGIAHNTVKYHVSEILAKLDVESRDEAAAWRGNPRVAFGLAPMAVLLHKLGPVSPLKLVGASAITIAVAGLVLLALGVLLGNGDASLGKIAFVRDGNIWAQEMPDGTPYQLTDGGGASGPGWSPSGEWLLYRVRDEDADEPPGIQLWLIRADGSQTRLLSDNGSGYWLPEGDARVLYYTNDEEAIAEDVDGGNRQTLFAPFEEAGERVRRFPLWWPSPDGEHQIYFETREPIDPPIRGAPSPATSIYVANLDGSDPVLLATIEPTADTQTLPVGFSSDGSHLLLVRTGDPVDGVPPATPLLAVPITGGEPVPLGLDISLLSPSDDGPPGRLVVAGAALEAWTDKRIALIAPDASQYSLLTPSAMAATAPAWSPDSRRIAFVSSPDFGLEARDSALLERRLWIMDADGSNQRQLTLGEGVRDEAPMWSNDGKHILFARLRPEVFCDGDKYELMLYSFEDGSVIEVTSDLAMSDWEPSADPNAVSLCESNSTPFQRDFAGIANVRQYLDWWQPANN